MIINKSLFVSVEKDVSDKKVQAAFYSSLYLKYH